MDEYGAAHRALATDRRYDRACADIPGLHIHSLVHDIALEKNEQQRKVAAE